MWLEVEPTGGPFAGLAEGARGRQAAGRQDIGTFQQICRWIEAAAGPAVHARILEDLPQSGVAAGLGSSVGGGGRSRPAGQPTNKAHGNTKRRRIMPRFYNVRVCKPKEQQVNDDDSINE